MRVNVPKNLPESSPWYSELEATHMDWTLSALFRCWVSRALNDKLVYNHLSAVLFDDQILNQWYHPRAFVRHQESAMVIVNLTVLLDSVSFQLADREQPTQEEKDTNIVPVRRRPKKARVAFIESSTSSIYDRPMNSDGSNTADQFELERQRQELEQQRLRLAIIEENQRIQQAEQQRIEQAKQEEVRRQEQRVLELQALAEEQERKIQELKMQQMKIITSPSNDIPNAISSGPRYDISSNYYTSSNNVDDQLPPQQISSINSNTPSSFVIPIQSSNEPIEDEESRMKRLIEEQVQAHLAAQRMQIEQAVLKQMEEEENQAKLAANAKATVDTKAAEDEEQRLRQREQELFEAERIAESIRIENERLEAERIAELNRQQEEIARKLEEDRLAQEEQRRQTEAAFRIAEEAKMAEEARQAQEEAMKFEEEARIAEETRRIAAEAEASRSEEEARIKRIQEEEEERRHRIQEEEEEARIAEQKRLIEEEHARQQQEALLNEEARLQEERLEEERQAELERSANEETALEQVRREQETKYQEEMREAETKESIEAQERPAEELRLHLEENARLLRENEEMVLHTATTILDDQTGSNIINQINPVTVEHGHLVDQDNSTATQTPHQLPLEQPEDQMSANIHHSTDDSIDTRIQEDEAAEARRLEEDRRLGLLKEEERLESLRIEQENESLRHQQEEQQRLEEQRRVSDLIAQETETKLEAQTLIEEEEAHRIEAEQNAEKVRQEEAEKARTREANRIVEEQLEEERIQEAARMAEEQSRMAEIEALRRKEEEETLQRRQEAAEAERIRQEQGAEHERRRLEAELEEQDRIRREAEAAEQERIHREAEAAERLRRKEEEARILQAEQAEAARLAELKRQQLLIQQQQEEAERARKARIEEEVRRKMELEKQRIEAEIRLKLEEGKRIREEEARIQREQQAARVLEQQRLAEEEKKKRAESEQLQQAQEQARLQARLQFLDQRKPNDLTPNKNATDDSTLHNSADLHRINTTESYSNPLDAPRVQDTFIGSTNTSNNLPSAAVAAPVATNSGQLYRNPYSASGRPVYTPPQTQSTNIPNTMLPNSTNSSQDPYNNSKSLATPGFGSDSISNQGDLLSPIALAATMDGFIKTGSSSSTLSSGPSSTTMKRSGSGNFVAVSGPNSRVFGAPSTTVQSKVAPSSSNNSLHPEYISANDGFSSSQPAVGPFFSPSNAASNSSSTSNPTASSSSSSSNSPPHISSKPRVPITTPPEELPSGDEMADFNGMSESDMESAVNSFDTVSSTYDETNHNVISPTIVMSPKLTAEWRPPKKQIYFDIPEKIPFEQHPSKICAKCEKPLTHGMFGVGNSRYCYYSGRYYCKNCHPKEFAIIPAYVLRKWDFTPRPVCKFYVEFLGDMMDEPLYDPKAIDSSVIRQQESLRKIQALRIMLFYMHHYFIRSCRHHDSLNKIAEKLIPRRSHLIHDRLYSLQDLIDVHKGTMLEALLGLSKFWMTHILNCDTCKDKGSFCQFCNGKEILYPFHLRHTVICPECKAVSHRKCYKKDECPRCKRLERRTVPK